MKISIDRISKVEYNTSRNTSASPKVKLESVLVPTGQYFCIGYNKFGKDKGVELYAVKNKNLPC